MLREIIQPTDSAHWLRERQRDVTSTSVAALFGFSKWFTAYELACIKTGKIEDTFESTERTEWGRAFEDAIAARIAKVYGVTVVLKKEYIRLPHYRLGASFDYEIIGVNDSVVEDNRLRLAFAKYGPGLLEIKNVDWLVFKSQWLASDQPEAPAHIEIQLQTQLACSDLAWGCIGALVGGNKLEIILRLRDDAVCTAIQNKAKKFWDDLAVNVYPPVTLPEDADVIKQLYGFAEPGKLLDARDRDDISALTDEYLAAGKDEKSAKDRKTTAQAQLLQLIGDHERVMCKTATISASMIAPTRIEAYDRTGYRGWKITAKKATGEKS